MPISTNGLLRRKYTPRNTLCILPKPGVLNDDSGPYWNNSPESMPYLDHHPSGLNFVHLICVLPCSLCCVFNLFAVFLFSFVQAAADLILCF